MTYPILADVVRGLFVEVASSDFAAGPRAVTDSRVSLLTGIHRKELRRQRTEPERGEPPLITLNSQVIARWLGDPAYANAEGAPAALTRTGSAPSFESLVATVTRDVRSRTVLDEWLAQGLVAVGADGLVSLRVPAFLPRSDLEARLYYFARNLHDHAQAGAANISAPGSAPFLDRSVHYDRLGPDAAAALETVAREAAQAVLLDVNRAAIALADVDEGTTPESERTRRVNFGVFVYAEAQPNAA